MLGLFEEIKEEPKEEIYRIMNVRKNLPICIKDASKNAGAKAVFARHRD